MGQITEPQKQNQIYVNELSEFVYSQQNKEFTHKKTHQKAKIFSYIFKGITNKKTIENYYHHRKLLHGKQSQQHPQTLLKLFEHKCQEIKENQSIMMKTRRISADNNFCSGSARTSNAQKFVIRLVAQSTEVSLQEEIYNRAGKKYFQEIQLWSVLSSCVLGALQLLELGLKQPVLSPKAIGLSKEGIVKVGEWELLTHSQIDQNNCMQEGEVIMGQKIQSKDYLSQILLGYYWPPQGIKAMEQITNLGRRNNEINSIDAITKTSKFQIFSLGMTLISMCLRNCFYQIETFSEKYIKKLINQATNIRNIEGKPLSNLMQKVISLTVKWEADQRISYYQLKNIIIQYFSTQHHQQSESSMVTVINHQHSLSTSDISENISESLPHNQISIVNNSMNIVLLSQLVQENKKSSHFENYSKKSSLQIIMKSNCVPANSFEGSGRIEHSLGDDCPLEAEQIRLPKEDEIVQKYSYRSSLRNATSNRLKNSVMSYRSVQHKSDLFHELRKSRQSQISNKLRGQIIQPLVYDSEDSPQSIVAEHLITMGEQQEEENPDLFEELCEITASEQNSYTDRTFKQDQNLTEHFTQQRLPRHISHHTHSTSIKIGFQIEDSPIKQRELQSESFSVCFQENQQKQHKNYEIISRNQNLFTDPKLLDYIKSSISLEQNSQIKNPSMSNRQFKKGIEPKQFSSFGRKQEGNSSRLKQSYNKENQCRINNFDIRQGQIQKKKSNQYDNWIRVECESVVSSPEGREKTPAHSNRVGCSSENHRLVKEQMSKGFYEGGKKNGARFGYGVFYYNQGGKYRGNWLNNKMHGKGTLEYADGRIAYEGDWAADHLHGQGILYNQTPITTHSLLNYKDLDVLDEHWVYYQGTFEWDQKAGKGIFILTNGQKFTGQFENDFAHGYGQYYRRNGQIIKGYWAENQLITVYSQERVIRNPQN